MQSKTSSFKLLDKALLKRNLTRFWPFTAVYAFFVLWMLPGIELFDLKLSNFLTHEEMAQSFMRNIYYDQLPIALWTSFIAGIILALCVFGYLQNERSCYFYHSLPVTREQLFFSSLLSGLIMLYVPNLVAYGLTLILATSYSIPAIGCLSTWLLVISVEELFFLSLATICMILAGNSVVSAFIYLIFNFLYGTMLYPVNGIYRNLFYGMNDNFMNMPHNSFGIVYPTAYASYLNTYFDDKKNVFVIENMGPVLATFAVCAVILLALSLFIYNKRKSENSGDIIAIKVLRPIFRCGFGICLSLLLTWMIADSLFPYNDYTLAKQIATGIVLVVIAIIGYIAAEMIMMKSVRVFSNLKVRILIYSAVVVICSIAMVSVGRSESCRVPEKEDIESVYVSLTYSASASFEDNENINLVRDMHKYIVDNFDEITNDLSAGNYYDTLYFSVIYTLKDGKSLDRTYRVPRQYAKMCEMAEELAYKNTKAFIFGEAKENDFSGSEVYIYNKDNQNGLHLDLTFEETKLLYNAVLKDIDEGNLDFETALLYGNQSLSYIAASGNGEYKDTEELDYSQKFPSSIEFTVEVPRGEYRSYSYMYKHLNFNEDCVNIVEAIMSTRTYQDSVSVAY